MHALLGENGAGKSTLIKILSGVYQPDGGEILIDGREARFATPEDAKRAGVATIYQELLLFPELTVAENIFLGHAPRAGGGRIDWRAMRAKAEALLASLEIDDLAADQIVGALSVGNRQRVEILRALSHDARILIMDEPTAALTESDVTRLFDIVRRLKARGVGIVYISHRLDEIFADRRPRHGAARRRLCRRASGRRHDFRRTRADDGRPADRQPLSQDRRADRRAGARGARHRAPADDQERQPHRARGRDRRPRRPRRLRAQRVRPDDLRRHARPNRARSGSWARPSGSIRPKARAPRESPTSPRTAACRASSGR